MNAVTHLIDISALCYLCVLLRKSTLLKSYRKKPFTVAIVLAAIATVSEMMSIAVDGKSHLIGLNIGFGLSPAILLALIAIFDAKALNKYKLILIPWVINLFALALSPLNGAIFLVDAAGRYTRGVSFSIFVAVYIVYLLFLLIYTLYITQKNRYPIGSQILLLLCFVVIFTGIQLVRPEVLATWHCVTIALILYYLLMSGYDCSFDNLSGLYNRITFDRVAKQLTGKISMSLVILDINDFKNVNDTYGHHFGDTVIKEVADSIRESFDRPSTCYRIGGDEFAVISCITDREKLEKKIEKMNNGLMQKRKLDARLPTIAYGTVFSAEFQRRLLRG